MNLSARMRKAQTFTMYQLASDMDNREIIKKSSDGKNFYTYANISSWYKGTSAFAVLAKNMVFLAKPGSGYSHKIELDLDKVCSDYGLVEEGKKVIVDPLVYERTRYYTDLSGFGKDDTYAISYISKQIAGLYTIGIAIERNLPIMPLIKVGESVKFLPQTVEYGEMSGKYILKSSDLTFHREKDWQATAAVYLIRTTKTKNG